MYKMINANILHNITLMKNNIVVFAPGIICTCRTAVLMAILLLYCIYNIISVVKAIFVQLTKTQTPDWKAQAPNVYFQPQNDYTKVIYIKRSNTDWYYFCSSQILPAIFFVLCWKCFIDNTEY